MKKKQLGQTHQPSKDNELVVRLLTTEREEDPHRLAQRQKQIDFGKNTLGYDRYCLLVPRHKRRRGDPKTPDRTLQVSKKRFDGMIRRWRQELHKYDPPATEATTNQSNHHEMTPTPTQQVHEWSTGVDEETERDTGALDSSHTCLTAPEGPSIFDAFVEDEVDLEDDDDLL